MSLLSPHYLHNFFRNKEMNEIYISYGILNFALGLISVFVPIYLYQLGYSMPHILLYFFLFSLAFVLFSFLGAQIVSHLGVKHTELASMPILIGYFIGLQFLPSYPILFYILPTIIAMKTVLYNFSFHLNFVEHSDVGNRGKQISLLQSSALLTGALAPLFGGLIIKFFDFQILFGIGTALLVASTVPLFLSPDRHEPLSFDSKSLFGEIFHYENFSLFSSFAGYAIESWIGSVIWPVFIFLLLAGTEGVGAVTTLSTAATLLIFYFVGHATDRQHWRPFLKWSTILYFWGWIGKMFVQDFISVAFIDTYKRLTGRALQIPLAAYSYDLASRRDYFKFIVQREVVYNLSRVAMTPFLMLIFVADYHPFRATFLVAAVFSLLYLSVLKIRDYGDMPEA
ncbi:MAG: MFS transporter [Patescibacteria group bacterium]